MSLMYLGMPSLYLLFYLPKKLRYNGGSFFVKRESILNGGLFLKNRVSVYLSIAVSIYLSAIVLLRLCFSGRVCQVSACVLVR